MIRCFLYRRRLSACVDSDLELAPTLGRHVELCGSCRSFYNQELFIARNLARNARKERGTPSPFLQARVMAAIGHSDPQSRLQSWFAPLAWSGGLAAGFLLLLRTVHGPFAPHPVVTSADLNGVIKELTALKRSLPDQQKLQQWTGTVDQPLDQEMRSLIHDARSAAQMLVQNFLPDNLDHAATLPDPEKNQR